MKPLFFIGLILAFASPLRLFGQRNQNTDYKNYKSTASAIILQKLINEQGIKNREIKMLIVDFPPKSASPAHRHPCPTFGYILEGEIESEFEGVTHLYKKGDSFYEPTNGLHRVARNISPSNPARLLVFFIAEKDKPTSVTANK